ncbi:MAG: MBL fold metallo-hydrolase [Bacteroidales bacterium]
MHIETLIYNSFQVNTYLLWTDDREAIVVDPAFHSPEERRGFDRLVKDKSLQLIGQVQTYCHVDHVLGCHHIKSKYGLPVRAHRDEADNLRNVARMGEMFGLDMDEIDGMDDVLESPGSLFLGGEEIVLLHVPGHSPGSLSYYLPASAAVLTGDALFSGQHRPKRFAGGNHATLVSSIRARLLTLPGHTLVFPGHGPSSTVGKEALENPFLQGAEHISDIWEVLFD